MVVAIIVGILVGAVSIVPFSVSMKKIRTVDPTHALNLLGPFLATIAVSFVILIAGMVVCKLAFPQVALAYAAAELMTFVIGVVVFGVFIAKRR